MGLFSKSKSDAVEEPFKIDYMKLINKQSERIEDLDVKVSKLEGHIRSLRGYVNRMRGSLPDEEDIKTSDTDILKGI